MILFLSEYATFNREGRPRQHRIAVVAEPQQDYRIVGVFAIGRKLDPATLRHDISDMLSEEVVGMLEKEAEELWTTR